MSEGKSWNKIGFGIAFIGLCVIFLVIITPAPSEQPKVMDLGTTFSWGYENKYDLNVTAPIEATHYTVEMGSNYVYLGTGYYDAKEVPEDRIIEVHRSGVHQVKIFYWVHEENQYYRLIGMGVYEN